MKKGSDKLDDMQHKAESLKAVFAEVSKQKAAYDKAMQSVGATGKEKGLYWNREEVNNMKSLAKTIANESKRQQKFLEKFKAKCEKTLSAAKAANAKGEKNSAISETFRRQGSFIDFARRACQSARNNGNERFRPHEFG